MTRQEAKELLPIIQAFSEGKTIQFNTLDHGWVDYDAACFDGDTNRYRIKPEPREFWILETLPYKNLYVFTYKDAAEVSLKNNPGSRLIHVREIL